MDAKSRKRDISQLEEIDEPCTSINVHGAVTSISPIKKGRKALFFDATLADTTSKVRVVGFSPQQQILLNDLHKTGSPVELTNCEVKHSRQGQGYDIMLKSNTQIRKSPKKIDMDTIMTLTPECKIITLDALPTLPQYEKVSVNVKVLQLFKREEVGQDKKVKREASVADHTAATRVVLWEQHVDALQEGKCYNLKNFHVKEFQSKKHLSMPKSNFEISPIDNIENTVKPLPEDDEYTTIHDVQVIGVQQLDTYKACLQCKARVEPLTPPLGKCTKENCLMVQLFDLCQEQISARVLLRHYTKRQYNHITCSVFGEAVYQLANVPKDHPITKVDLLKSQPPIHEVQFLTDKKIITSILRQT